MKIIVVLLCGFACQVFAQTNGVFPAKILSNQKVVSESSDLYITCSITGSKKPSAAQGFIHLCKDGRVVRKKQQKPNQKDTFFIIRVGLHDGGNYSCVFSVRDLPLSTAAATSLNIIPIRVIANFHPADISFAGPPAVKEGDDVALRCSVSDTLQTLGGCQFIQSYLIKNGTMVQLTPFNATRMEVEFTVKDVALKDSGHYSCVVLPSKCIKAAGTALYGNNRVFLEVKVNKIKFCNQCEVGYATVMERSCELEEQQEQAGGDNLEAPSDDSFSMDEENIYDDINLHDSSQ
ncbi:immunoglobulin superfamily member 1-like isoform X2 [Takifugu rubripes]|uniref:immunoglobulin superfamily member 1-like isoform X2 n=1 Tax=Takifugu rubripes TaxID=31033 RepID=UPI001145317B|nr:immunoglobulin superfamily member 1-like isoform X2 [Takifugu rubripes]XP_029702558.1 immunoglobulin superfamily member 1 isoform X2 [Takifugu rubripes]